MIFLQMNQAIQFLKKDKVMKSIIAKIGEVTLTKNPNYFESLVEQMIYQQITGKAAATIFQRFKALFPKENVTPKFLLKLTEDELLSAGISRQKRGYLYSLSEKFLDGTIKPDGFEQLTDEDIITDLIKAKGIGPWTAQMFLIFTLAREDVFAPDDLGLRKAIQLHYKMEELPKPKELEEFAKRWKPYRSYASHYLWRSLK